MRRSQIYLTETHLKTLAAVARTRCTTHSALIREALDQYLARQTPQDKRAARAQAFGAWAANKSAPTVRQLRDEERFGDDR